jgi:hypothetical protein
MASKSYTPPRGDFWLFLATARDGKTVFLRLFTHREPAEETAESARAGGYDNVNVVPIDVNYRAVKCEPLEKEKTSQ